MNEYIDVERLEFVITNKCSGKCKHCSAIFSANNESIDVQTAINIINELCKKYSLNSLMTFGGEPLLYADTVCKIHETAFKNNVKNRELITNGYFSKNIDVIDETARKLCESNISKVLLSVDAFHQETIPIEPVIHFANALVKYGFKGIKTHPAWLVNKDHGNSYNKRTREILNIFLEIGIEPSNGNIIFPAGNAIKYLREFFQKPDEDELFLPCGSLPYTEKIDEIKSISINPNGDVSICSFSIGNVYDKNILEIVEQYDPFSSIYTKMIVEGGVKKLFDYALEQGLKIDMEDCYSTCMLCKKIMDALKMSSEKSS